ncbi:MAG: GxxExxY protein [Arcticibacter sp.]|jgi:GxxExxY protein
MNKTNNYAFSGITDKIIKAFYKVYNNLGYGFLEKVYEKAIIWELEKEGIPFQKQMPIMIFYDGRKIGKFIPDLIIEEKVVVEIKAVSCLLQCHEDQLRNALRASGMEVGLLLNFGIQPQIKRKVFSNEFKKGLINENLMDLNHKNPS